MLEKDNALKMMTLEAFVADQAKEKDAPATERKKRLKKKQRNKLKQDAADPQDINLYEEAKD